MYVVVEVVDVGIAAVSVVIITEDADTRAAEVAGHQLVGFAIRRKGQTIGAVGEAGETVFVDMNS